VLASDGPRYERGELLQLAATAGHVRSSRLPDLGQPVDVTVRTVAQLPGKLEALAFNSPEFAAALRHDQALAVAWDNASLSGWDLSAGVAGRARRLERPGGRRPDRLAPRAVARDDPEAGTSDYYVRRTVAIARASANERTEMAA
jgi:hypothetical protein